MSQESTETQSQEPALVVQEVKYVTDRLRLSLYKGPDSNSGVLQLLSSGDALEILSIRGPYSRVRTETGIIGWVKNGFLVSEPTANLQLAEELKRSANLARQLEQYADTQQMVKNYENTITEIKKELEDRDEKLIEGGETLQQLSENNSELEQKIEHLQQHAFQWSDIILLLKQYWYVAAVSLLIMFFLGLILGRELVESKIRQKFHGVKVW
jgi:SH3 domain protein